MPPFCLAKALILEPAQKVRNAMLFGKFQFFVLAILNNSYDRNSSGCSYALCRDVRDGGTLRVFIGYCDFYFTVSVGFSNVKAFSAFLN